MRRHIVCVRLTERVTMFFRAQLVCVGEGEVRDRLLSGFCVRDQLNERALSKVVWRCAGSVEVVQAMLSATSDRRHERRGRRPRRRAGGEQTALRRRGRSPTCCTRRLLARRDRRGGFQYSRRPTDATDFRSARRRGATACRSR